MDIIAHRGASHDAPENTLAAARLAWQQGADALECDVRLTADERLVLLHDADTQRTARIFHRASNTPFDVLQTLDVGGWKDANFIGEKIPTLDQLLSTVPAGKRVFIELKDGPEGVAALARCLARCTLNPERVAIISFHLDTARAAKNAFARCEVSWILERQADGTTPPLDAVIAQCCDAGLDGLDLDAEWPVDTALAQRVRDAGLKLYVWTVDEPPRARELAAAGVDGITTNRPGWLREQLR